MQKEKFEELSYRVARLERLCSERKHPMNEGGPLLAKVLPVIVKNLPLLLDLMPQLAELLNSDQINDNSDKVEKIEEFTKLGKEIVDMLNSFGKK